ncbi:MAG: hypothetical protein Cons2KO_33910 [Congregibacter sp.]
MKKSRTTLASPKQQTLLTPPPLALTLAMSPLFLTACGGGGGGNSAPPPSVVEPPPAASGLLIPPSNESEFVSAFTRRLAPSITLQTDSESQTPGFSTPPTLGLDAGSGFSTRYQLEAGVDEYDAIQYDGDRLYIAPTRGGCCFPIEPFSDVALPPPPDDGERRIRILATDTVSASGEEIGAIELSDGETIEGLYLQGEQLIALHSSAWWGHHGEAFESIVAWQGESAGIRVYDVSDAQSPQQDWSVRIEGVLVSSRLIGDKLIMLSRHLPSVEGLDYQPQDDQARAANQSLLDSLSAGDLLPRVTIDGELADDVLTADACLITDDANEIAPDEPGYPVLTTLLQIDLTTQTVSDALCYAEASDGVYVSSRAVYIAQNVWESVDDVDTIVHRIDLGDSLDYRGSGRIGGSLTNRGQADFRMSEHDDTLRLVTTGFTNDESDAFDHQLYTLRLASGVPELQTLAQFPGAGSEQAIGKPNEDLFGVRFLGERAYLVTFERIDPLYVIDLGDPSNPQLLGELEVEGFSDLLHPVTDELLLGVGDDGEGRVKVELFNVSTPSMPLSQGSAVLAQDAQWSSSDARYNRQAFSYLRGSSDTDRFTIPVSLSLETESGYEQHQRLYMFEIRGTTNAGSAFLESRGFLAVKTPKYFEPRPRSIIHEDAVFFVLGQDLWSGYWAVASEAFGPF